MTAASPTPCPPSAAAPVGHAAAESAGATRLLLVDAHDRSRRASRGLLAALPGLVVVGDTGEHAEALALAASCRPDVVLISMRVRGGSGARTTAALRECVPGLPVVVWTLFDSPEYVLAALHAGALGYVLKQSPSSELVAAIAAARCGQRHLGAGLLPPANGGWPEGCAT